MLCREPAGAGWFRAQREEAYRRGSRFSVSSAELFEGAYLLLATGDLEQGGEAVRIALQLQELWGSDADRRLVGARRSPAWARS